MSDAPAPESPHAPPHAHSTAPPAHGRAPPAHGRAPPAPARAGGPPRAEALRLARGWERWQHSEQVVRFFFAREDGCFTEEVRATEPRAEDLDLRHARRSALRLRQRDWRHLALLVDPATDECVAAGFVELARPPAAALAAVGGAGEGEAPCVTNLGVRAGWRGRGLGRRVLADLLAQVRGAPEWAGAVWIAVWRAHPRRADLERLYAEFGFRFVCEDGHLAWLMSDQRG